MSYICGSTVSEELVNQFIKRQEAYNDSIDNSINKKYANLNKGYFHKMNYATCEMSFNHNYCRTYKQDNCLIIFDGRLYDRSTHDDLSSEQFILELYLKNRDTNFLEKLNGDFCFCIFDADKNKIICVRSPFGIRPFYYSLRHNGFSFASNLEQLVDINYMSQEINEESLSRYIINYLHRPSISRLSCTPYHNVFKLQPGHVLIYENGNRRVSEYWRPNIKCLNLNETEISDMFKKLMITSVKERIKDIDKKINVSFSGGLDSSTVVYILHELSKEQSLPPVLLNHQVYDETGNELHYAQYGSNHTGFPLNIQYMDKKSDTWLFKDFEPIRKDILPNFAVLTGGYSKESTDKDIENLFSSSLTGCGGDHILCGHPFYLASYLRRFRLVKAMRQTRIHAQNANMDFAATFMKYALKPNFKFVTFKDRATIDLSSYMGEKFNRELIEDLRIKKISEDLSVQDDYENLLLTDQWSDIGSSTFDTRHPFMDQRLVDFCFSIEGQYRFNGERDRVIQRIAMTGIVGDKILRRKDKGSNLASNTNGVKREWSNLEKYFDHFYLEKLGFLRKGTIEMLLNRIRIGVSHGAADALRIITLEFWLQSFME